MTHRMSFARAMSILAKSVLIKSASSPANSVPEGPPPTTMVWSSRARSCAVSPAPQGAQNLDV